MARKDRKTYIVDTSVLLNDPGAIDRLAQGNNVVIPIWVIIELDAHKQSSENAREATRIIDGYRETASAKNLSQGVKTKNGGLLCIDPYMAPWSELPDGFEHNNDNRILLVGKRWKQKKSTGQVIILSCDGNLRVLANTLGLKAEDYRYEQGVETIDELYTGLLEVQLQPDQYGLLTELGQNKQLSLNLLISNVDSSRLVPNQCIKLICGEKFLLTTHRDGILHLVSKDRSDNGSVKPKNSEQWFAYHLLCRPEIRLVTLAGKAGTGKTLIALLAGWQQVEKNYKQIIVYRPNIELGRPLGFLPGEIDDKFRPWMYPVFDNMKLILGGDHDETVGKGKPRMDRIQDLIQNELLSIEPLAYIRGRSLNDAFVIVDEAQNLTRHEARTILTRPGENSKIVLTGDPSQIDNPYLSKTTNGLVVTISRFKGEDNFGHIILTRGERSRLADQADRLL